MGVSRREASSVLRRQGEETGGWRRQPRVGPGSEPRLVLSTRSITGAIVPRPCHLRPSPTDGIGWNIATSASTMALVGMQGHRRIG
jgi:hypothetical protein